MKEGEGGKEAPGVAAALLTSFVKNKHFFFQFRIPFLCFLEKKQVGEADVGSLALSSPPFIF